MVPSPKLGVQERSDLPPEQQPPRGARRKCWARPLPTANVAGCINALICPTSIEHSTSPYVVHGQRSVGGSPAYPEVVRVGGPLAGWTWPKHTTLPLPKRCKNGAQRSVRVFPFISVTARWSVDLDDDKVVSVYEEDWPEGE